jgi:RNA polymerase sigma factor (sigma-70 family)
MQPLDHLIWRPERVSCNAHGNGGGRRWWGILACCGNMPRNLKLGEVSVPSGRRPRPGARTRAARPENPPVTGVERLSSAIEQFAPRLTRFLEMRTGSRQDAQDLAQEAYFRLCRVREPDLIQAPESYLFRIASNLAHEFLLRRRVQPNFVELDPDHGEDVDPHGRSFGAELEARSDVEQLERIIDELPPLYQAVLLMRKRDGYSHEEIAEKLSISPHTVHKYLSRALLRCRTLWAERSHD